MGKALDLADNWLNLSRVELTVYTDNAAGVEGLFCELRTEGVLRSSSRF
jgi:hypothetical protein